jgi:hypothetical protein
MLFDRDNFLSYILEEPVPRLGAIGNVELRVYFADTDRHKAPHFHAASPEEEILVSIPEITVLEGRMKATDRRRVLAWARANAGLLIAEWNRCNPQQPVARRD